MFHPGLHWPLALPYKVGPQFVNAKLVNITPISLWFMVYRTIVFMGVINPTTMVYGIYIYIYIYITIVHGGYKPTYS